MSHSPSLVYATLAWVTAVAAFQEKTSVEDSNYLLSRALEAVQEDLKEIETGSLPSDGTIAAVACLM